jgi:hypothetical protein
VTSIGGTLSEGRPTGRIVREDRSDLGESEDEDEVEGESEDEDEVEVELERGDGVLALGGRFDHSRTLARTIV